MVSPVFDEAYIVHLLRAPPAPDSLAAIQSGAMQALIDMYDRKATREEFIDNASTCVALYGQCAKLWMLRNVQDTYDRGLLDRDQFKVADDGIADLIRKQAESVIEIIKRLQMCAEDEDKVH